MSAKTPIADRLLANDHLSSDGHCQVGELELRLYAAEARIAAFLEAAATFNHGPNSFTADGWRTMSPETQRALGEMVRKHLKS
jgi:hypothetical protein